MTHNEAPRLRETYGDAPNRFRSVPWRHSSSPHPSTASTDRVMTPRCSPATRRLSQAGTCRGGFTPSRSARTGSHNALALDRRQRCCKWCRPLRVRSQGPWRTLRPRCARTTTTRCRRRSRAPTAAQPVRRTSHRTTSSTPIRVRAWHGAIRRRAHAARHHAIWLAAAADSCQLIGLGIVPRDHSSPKNTNFRAGGGSRGARGTQHRKIGNSLIMRPRRW
jgi:hypothetical protein